jgi:hypothetical protein
MTPKQKAKEIANKFYYYVESISESQQKENAKQCALISVDEIIGNNKSFLRTNNDLHNDDGLDADLEYWLKVKEEINKF